MSAYLDASVLVSAFTRDPLTARAAEILGFLGTSILVSDFAEAEFASAIARKVRMGELTPTDAKRAFEAFDQWLARSTSPAQLPGDIRHATKLLRSLGMTLRAPDALHLAIALRTDASLATFDRGMVASAEMLGIELVLIDRGREP